LSNNQVKESKELVAGSLLGKYSCPELVVKNLEYWKNKWLGEVFEMEDGDFVKIVEYRKSRSITVEFLNTGYRLDTELDRVKEGKLKDRRKPSVHSVGIVGEQPISTNQKHHKEYQIWEGMLDRCYNKITQNKQPSYSDCSVSEYFLYYPNFKDWCNKQIGFKSVDDKGKSFQLDKDILVKGNRVYSTDTCCFVPSEINSLMVGCKRKKGSSMVGTAYDKKLRKFRSSIVKCGVKYHLGCYATEIEAFNAYREAKESYLKEVANKWKNKIDPTVYNALISYEIETTD
jgi:hypothetical protein